MSFLMLLPLRSYQRSSSGPKTSTSWEATQVLQLLCSKKVEKIFSILPRKWLAVHIVHGRASKVGIPIEMHAQPCLYVQPCAIPPRARLYI